MNGATAEPWAKTTSRPNKTRMIIIGASQKRLRILRKSQNSLIMDILPICHLLFKIVADNVPY